MSCGSARAILTATETFYLHGGGSWREGETTGFWFISSLPSYHYGNVTPCQCFSHWDRAEQHINSWGHGDRTRDSSFPTEMNAERGLSELPFAPPSGPVHKAEENTYRSSRGDLGKVLAFLRSREMASNVIWFKLAQIWVKSPFDSAPLLSLCNLGQKILDISDPFNSSINRR